MTPGALLDSWEVVHHDPDPSDPADEGYRCFTCPKCGGAGKLIGCFDNSGQFSLACKCTNPTTGRRFTSDELARWLGVNGHASTSSEAALPTQRFERSDAGNAELLADLFGGNLRYVHGPNVWRVWAGGRWRADTDGAADRFVLDAAKERLLAAAEIPDAKAASDEAKWAIGSRSAKRVRDCLTIAGSIHPFTSTPAQYDANPWALNVANGILDLRTGDRRDHDPAAMHSKLAPVEYTPGAECPRWQRFLDEVFAGNADLSDFLRRAVGYSLTGDTREQALFVLHGSGANGKTTLLAVLKRLLGEYQQNADFATFAYAREKQAGVRDDLAALAGARLVTASEAAVGMRFSEGRVKQLTGGDPVTCRHLHGRYFDYQPTFKVWLSCNHRPTVRDSSEAFWRRVHLVPFTVSFRGREDTELLDKLTAEAPGILAWAVLGCLEWQRDGLNPPDAVRAATASYRQEEDVIANFLADRTEAAPGAVTLSKHLTEAYLSWCDANTETPVRRKTFTDALREHGYLPDKASGGVRAWRGVRLCE
jgi:putative DNA primase/helicase